MQIRYKSVHERRAGGYEKTGKYSLARCKYYVSTHCETREGESMKEHLRAGIGLLAGVILWKGAVVAPDGKVTGTISPSSATTAGSKTGDQIELIERRRFRLVAPHDQRVKPAFADDRHFLRAAKGLNFSQTLFIIIKIAQLLRTAKGIDFFYPLLVLI